MLNFLIRGRRGGGRRHRGSRTPWFTGGRYF